MRHMRVVVTRPGIGGGELRYRAAVRRSLEASDFVQRRWKRVRGGRPSGSLRETAALAVRQQHDLAEHSAFAQHLVRAARLLSGNRWAIRGLILPCFEQVQQR